MFVNRNSRLFTLAIVLFCLPILLGELWLGEFHSHEACRRSGEGEGPYPAGGVGYPRLALLRPLAARVPRKLTQNLGRGVLSTFAMVFCEKMGPFWGGGCPPIVAPEGDLGFRGKPSFPLYLFISMEFTFVQPTGVLGV
jgi:hypothetical protein